METPYKPYLCGSQGRPDLTSIPVWAPRDLVGSRCWGSKIGLEGRFSLEAPRGRFSTIRRLRALEAHLAVLELSAVSFNADPDHRQDPSWAPRWSAGGSKARRPASHTVTSSSSPRLELRTSILAGDVPHRRGSM